ncbi:uncharacterized protein EV420DRAFT_1550579 [Desarmillaria tabescens]|uniref:CRAL-TRIO domain-containing protein n=1 Tax=Armillaria tabescens TaxID=1929756 RepID=A0AA39KA42_ARMTA|nr:uncharacterized protein EV420DRAFT_1550579 [Desarmillaria tabescens]KAK0457379.1 hypothetical protein EV420DRAFT_1550579 [Desarmillaria tabescens]
MIPFLWLSQLFHSLLRFVMPPQHSDEMRVFSRTKDVTNASSLLSSLKENYHFLDHGLRNIVLTQVEYCKCRFSQDSPGEHEFLLVTLKELVGARRPAYLMVDRLNDDTKKYRKDELLADLVRHQDQEMAGMEETDSSDSSTSSSAASLTLSTTASMPRVLPAAPTWDTPSRAHRSIAKVKITTKGDPPDALDRLIILPRRGDVVSCAGEFDVLMTMDLSRSENVTLERFAHLLRTTSSNTPQYHLIFAQCYWYAYTIWRVLEMAVQPRVYMYDSELAKRQCSHRLTGYGNRLVLGRGKSVNAVRSPETIKAQWEMEKFTEDQEWAELKQALHAPEEARREAEAALRQAEARVRELERRLESCQRPTAAANAV